jgi:transcription initiation factor IIE alpha subunit
MIIDQLEDIDSSKIIFEDENQLNDINKEIARYHCLNARIT